MEKKVARNSSPFGQAKIKPRASVATKKVDLSINDSRLSGIEVHEYNKKDFESLADNYLSVPRDPIIKILFAAYLFVHPFKDSYSEIIEKSDTNQMKHILKPVFNPKNVTSPDSLISKMKQFDEDPFKSGEPNYHAIIKLVTTQDMSKVNPKALHSKLPAVWTWVFSHLKKQQEKDNSLDLSFKNPAPKFLISPKHADVRKSITFTSTTKRRTKEERNLK